MGIIFPFDAGCWKLNIRESVEFFDAALDSDDLLYLKEQMEAEEDAERLLRRTEKRAFQAFKISFVFFFFWSLWVRLQQYHKTGKIAKCLVEHETPANFQLRLCCWHSSSFLPTNFTQFCLTFYTQFSKDSCSKCLKCGTRVDCCSMMVWRVRIVGIQYRFIYIAFLFYNISVLATFLLVSITSLVES